MTQSYDAWTAREEHTMSALDPWPAQALRATLGLEPSDVEPLDTLPPLWSWLYFLETPPRSALGRDGHAALGGFMPPVPAERRMFAGCRFRFLRPLRLGSPAEQVRRIDRIEAKTGAAGVMTFVTVAHDQFQDGELCVEERRDVVYLQAASRPASTPPAAVVPEAPLSLDLAPDAVMLARFSALTFNGHRIHYDLPYAQDVEGYPERVVHGPLTAMMLAELVRLQGYSSLRAFRFRARAPFFLGDVWRLRGGPNATGTLSLGAYDGRGALVMMAEAEVGQ